MLLLIWHAGNVTMENTNDLPSQPDHNQSDYRDGNFLLCRMIVPWPNDDLSREKLSEIPPESENTDIEPCTLRGGSCWTEGMVKCIVYQIIASINIKDVCEHCNKFLTRFFCVVRMNTTVDPH